MNHWETCPACGLMFETKKTEREPPMEFTVNITGEVTPDSAAALAQLFSVAGKAPTAPIMREPVAPAAPITREPVAAKTETPVTESEPRASEPPSELTPKQLTELKTNIRAKCLELKGAGKNSLASEAIKSLGYEKLSEVPSDKYSALWEVLKDAG